MKPGSRFVIGDSSIAVAIGPDNGPDEITKVERKVIAAVYRAFPMARRVMFEFFHCTGTCGDGPPGEIHHLVRVAMDVHWLDSITLVRNLHEIRSRVANAYGQETVVNICRMRRATSRYVGLAIAKAEQMSLSQKLLDELRRAAAATPQPPAAGTAEPVADGGPS